MPKQPEKKPPQGSKQQSPSSQLLARDDFKRRALEQISQALPSSERFVDVVPKPLQHVGDSDVLDTEVEDAYNVAVNRAFTEFHRTQRKALMYHQYTAYPEHGAEVVAAFRDAHLPSEFRVAIRASAVKWENEWPAPPAMELQHTEYGLIARTVEYGLIFEAESDDELHQMLKIINEKFTQKPGHGKAAPMSWEIPDARVMGLPEGSPGEVYANELEDGRIITLSKEPLPGVQSRKLVVNDQLYGVIR